MFAPCCSVVFPDKIAFAAGISNMCCVWLQCIFASMVPAGKKEPTGAPSIQTPKGTIVWQLYFGPHAHKQWKPNSPRYNHYYNKTGCFACMSACRHTSISRLCKAQIHHKSKGEEKMKCEEGKARRRGGGEEGSKQTWDMGGQKGPSWVEIR